MPVPNRFASYKAEASLWITLDTAVYYPDYLPEALDFYTPVIVNFGMLVKSSESSEALFRRIVGLKGEWMRVQLLRVFKRYVSPSANVENTRRKAKLEQMLVLFRDEMRPIQEVQAAYETRPEKDEAICALLWEGKTRGASGYELARKFFDLFAKVCPELEIDGSTNSSKDILVVKLLPEYPNDKRKVDFVVFDSDGFGVVALGYAHYDSDRGGGQEDDRTGNYYNFAHELQRYHTQTGKRLKAVFINDGPGLLAGSMWDDYAGLEEMDYANIRVMTLRMIPERLSTAWLLSQEDTEG